MNKEDILKEQGIDAKEAGILLERFNSQKEASGSEFAGFPSIDGKQVISGTDIEGIVLPKEELIRFISSSLPEFSLEDFSLPEQDGEIFADAGTLETFGVLLYPYTAFGILNGGSATSYIDSKKNLAYGTEIFTSSEELFNSLVPLCSGKPKGLTPGFIHPDGSPGKSFMYLKVRSLMIESLKYRRLMNDRFPDKSVQSFGIIPLFQMTSEFTHDQLIEELSAMKHDPAYRDLSDALDGAEVSGEYTAIQPLVAACNPHTPGEPLDYFMNAWGKENTPLPLPGGHGQNFTVLKDIYEKLYREGKRYAYLGNIDNLGNTIHPIYLAITALKHADASFEFSFKTPVDVKGGVLVINTEGHLDCMDIGPGIDMNTVQKHTDEGKDLLFNCASGLFSLEYLHRNLDSIIESLPLRISTQDKDAGRYSQIEQITWEVIGIMDNPLVIGVRKYERFIAAKLLIEQILTSMAPEIIRDPGKDPYLQSFMTLHKGFQEILVSRYGYTTDGGTYRMVRADELDL